MNQAYLALQCVNRQKPKRHYLMSTISSDNMVWLDLEMTGLNIEQDRIIEIATIVTDKQLNILDEGPVMAIHQPDILLSNMDEWNTKQHHGSGLVERVKQSSIDEAKAEKTTLDFLAHYVPEGEALLCGNSIYVDRKFLAKYMPQLESFFHYRLLDVSTLKELAKRWAPSVYKNYTKESEHLALEDIKDSINELAYYRQHLFLSDYQG